jgi:hypothetical protein
MTRRAKGPGALDFTALLRGWERASRVAELEMPRDLARTIWHATSRASVLTGRLVTQAQNPHSRLGGSRRAGTHEQLLADAPSEGAPYLAREQAAALLGADLGQLQTQLHAGAAGG